MNREPENETNPGNEGFVSRWSRRKSTARNETTTETESTPEPDANADTNLENLLEPTGANNEVTDLATTAPQEGGELTPEAEELTEADLPPIESLNEDSDYTAFMAPNVGAEIRNLALRKLFQSKVFNIRDGLDDYDDDFTTFEKLGDIVTSDMRHHAERKAKLLEEEEKRLAAEQASDHDSASASDSSETDETATDNIADANTEDEPDSARAMTDLQNDTNPTEPIEDGMPLSAEQLAAAKARPAEASEQLSGKLRRRPNQS